MGTLTTCEKFTDERGTMVFDFKEPPFTVIQSINTFNAKHALRGMHCSPYPKLVCCRTGRLLDVIVSPAGEARSPSLRFCHVIQAKHEQNDRCTGTSLRLVIPSWCRRTMRMVTSALRTLCCPISLAAHLFRSSRSITTIGVLFRLCSAIQQPLKFVSSTLFGQLRSHRRCPTLNICWPIPRNCTPIVNNRDEAAPLFRPVRYAVLGANGFLGQNLMKHLPGAIAVTTRLEDFSALERELAFLKPSHVLSAAGISGRPTTAWCEDHAAETLHGNITCQLNLMEVCRRLGLHLTLLGSGGVYEGPGVFTETDPPNATGSVYSKLRADLERFLPYYSDCVLFLRVHFPVSGDGHNKCFLSKLRSRLGR